MSSHHCLFPAATAIGDTGQPGAPPMGSPRGSGDDWYRAGSFKMELAIKPLSTTGIDCGEGADVRFADVPRHHKKEKRRGKRNHNSDDKGLAPRKQTDNSLGSKLQCLSEHYSSSDFSDDDIAHTSGQRLVGFRSATSRITEMWQIDRNGDNHFVHFGNAYRLDIPLYDTLDKDLAQQLSSDEIARRACALPEGLVSSPRQKKDKHRRSCDADDADPLRYHKKKRYFSPGAMAEWRQLSLPVWRAGAVRFRSSNERTSSSMLTHFVPVPMGPAEYPSQDDTTPVQYSSTEAEYFRGILRDIQSSVNRFRSVEEFSHLGRVWAWQRLCSAQLQLTELQQLVSGVITNSFRRGYSSLFTSSAMTSRSPTLCNIHYPIETLKIVNDKQISILEESVKEEYQQGSPISASAILYYRLLYLVNQRLAFGGSDPDKSSDSWGRIFEQMKARFPLSDLVVEASHSRLRAQFGACSVSRLRVGYSAEKQRLEGEYKNVRSSRKMLGDILNSSAGIGFERIEEEKMQASEIDNFYSFLSCENDAGYTERAVASIQAAIDLNFCLGPLIMRLNPTAEVVSIIDDFCAYWDSEAPRIGDVIINSCGLDKASGDPLCRDGGVLDESHGFMRWHRVGNVESQCHFRLSLGSSDWLNRGRPVEGWVDSHGFTFWENCREAPVDAVAPVAAAGESSCDVEACDRAESGSSFAEAFLNEWFLKEERASAMGSNRNMTPPLEVSGDLGSGTNIDMRGAEDSFIYSSVHGYRIPRPAQEDTSSTYKKILQDIKGKSSTTGEFVDSRRVAGRADSDQPEMSGLSDSDDIYVQMNETEAMLAIEQFAPLRIQCLEQQRLVEQQPDRVVFSDDIKSHVFLVSSKPSRGRLLMRCLEALGISFPNSCILPLSGLPSLTGQLGSTVLSDTMVHIVHAVHELSLRGLAAKNGLYGFKDTLLNFLDGSHDNGARGDATFCLSYVTCPVYVRVDVVKQYLISKSNEKFSKKSTDSVLNFVLRLLCRLLLLPISCESDDAKVDLLLPASFLSDLYCTVIKLLAIRFMLDLIILLESGESIQELQSSLLQNFRDDCKIALEHSSRAGSPIDVGVAAGRSTCALDCTVYTTYVTIEHYIGRFCAVLETSHSAGDRIHPLDDFGSKISVKIVKSVIAQYSEQNGVPPSRDDVDSMSFLEQNVCNAANGEWLMKWLDGFLFKLPGAASLISSRFCQQIWLSSFCSAGNILNKLETAEFIDTITAYAHFFLHGRFLSLKEISKQRKKAMKLGNGVHTTNNFCSEIADAAALLRNVIQIRFADLLKEFRPPSTSDGQNDCSLECATEHDAVALFQNLLGSEAILRLDCAPAEYHAGMLMVWMTYASALLNFAVSDEYLSSPYLVSNAVSRALDTFEILIQGSWRVLQALRHSIAMCDSTEQTARSRRQAKLKLSLSQWLTCLKLFLRSRIEFVYMIRDIFFGLTRKVRHLFYCGGTMLQEESCTWNFLNIISPVVKDTFRFGLCLFPNDGVLHRYLLFDTSRLCKTIPISVMDYAWAINTCDEIISKYLYASGISIDVLYSLWKTSLELKMNQTMAMYHTCSSLRRSVALFDRACAAFETFIEFSAMGSKCLPQVWLMYVHAMRASAAGRIDSVRRLFYRAVYQCPWSKHIWALATQRNLRNAFKNKELDDLKKVMEEKGIMQRIVL